MSCVLLKWFSPRGYVKNLVDLVCWFWSRSAVLGAEPGGVWVWLRPNDIPQHFTLLLGAGERDSLSHLRTKSVPFAVEQDRQAE